MGCQLSNQNNGEIRRKRPRKLGEVAVFFPSQRIPKSVDFDVLLPHGVPKNILERLADLRSRISASFSMKHVSIRTKYQGMGFAQEELLRALEEYLPVLLGLVKEGNEIEDKVEFTWINQMDDTEETTIRNAWYEVLSVLHLMSMLCFSHANHLLLSRTEADGYQQKMIEENRRISVDVFLKAAGYLDFAVQCVLPRLMNFKEDIPLDLEEGMLRALCQQALGEGVSIQLEMALDSPKATLAVKRRFGCEMVTYWKQALNNLKQIPSANDSDWGTKQELYVKWRCIEAKAAAYYYHGLIIKEGSETRSHGMAMAALQAADWFLRDSKRACESFNLAFPKSRTPAPLASSKSLAKKITKDAPLTCFPQKLPEMVPPLPDFAPALMPDEYQLPPLDKAWDGYKPLVGRMN